MDNFHFFVDSDRGEWQPPGTFFEKKNGVPSQSFRIFKSQNTQSHFNYDYPKINVKMDLVLQFFRKSFETRHSNSRD